MNIRVIEIGLINIDTKVKRITEHIPIGMYWVMSTSLLNHLFFIQIINGVKMNVIIFKGGAEYVIDE
jgi:hypothetical protein